MSDEIDVLWLVKGLGVGGAERLVVEHARHRSASIVPTVAYVHGADGDQIPEILATGATVRLLGSGRFGDLRWLADLHRLLRGVRPTLLHVHSPALAPAARILGRLHRIPVVSTEHGEWAQYRRPTRLANVATAFLDAQRLAVSDAVASSHRFGPIEPPASVLIHGVSASATSADRAETRTSLGVDDDELLILIVANLRPDKAPSVLLRAAERFLPRDRVRFVWAGGGPLAHEVQVEIERRGLADVVDLLGPRHDVPDLLAAADIFCLSSANEGLPVAIMEALGAGLPIVATDVGGVSSAVGGIDPAAVLVPPNRPDLLAQAIRRLADDADLRATLSRNASARAARFDPERTAGELEEIYRRVVSERR